MIFNIFFQVCDWVYKFQNLKQAPCLEGDEPDGLALYRNTKFQGKTEDPGYFDSNKNGVEFAYAGSFCAPCYGHHELRLKGGPGLKFQVRDFQPVIYDEELWNVFPHCADERAEIAFTVELYEHECIPITAQVYANILNFDISNKSFLCNHPNFYLYVNDTLLSNEFTLQCGIDDCLYPYTGEKCEYVAAEYSYCNEHGTPKRGRGKNFGCICDADYGNPFCENTTESKFENNGFRVTTEVTLNSNVTITKEISENLLESSYSNVVIEADLYVSQNTDLQFQINSCPNSLLEIFASNGTLIDKVGQKDSILNCNFLKKSITPQETERKYYERGFYKLRIESNTGCPVNNRVLDLRWKFYKWYFNDEEKVEWEPIPERYLGVPNPVEQGTEPVEELEK